jgi:hypothetical protein
MTKNIVCSSWKKPHGAMEKDSTEDQAQTDPHRNTPIPTDFGKKEKRIDVRIMSTALYLLPSKLGSVIAVTGRFRKNKNRKGMKEPQLDALGTSV